MKPSSGSKKSKVKTPAVETPAPSRDSVKKEKLSVADPKQDLKSTKKIQEDLLKKQTKQTDKKSVASSQKVSAASKVKAETEKIKKYLRNVVTNGIL